MNDWRAQRQVQDRATETVLTDSQPMQGASAGAMDTFFESSESVDSSEPYADDSQEQEHSSPVMVLAERALVERDALRGEVARLRDALLKMESNQRMGRSASRELQELREAVELRDREVKRLKDSNVARERLLVDARSKLDEAVHARSAALAKAETRERNAHEAEVVREELRAELSQWRKRAESAELEWHRAINAERGAAAMIEDLRQQLTEQQKALATRQEQAAEQQREFELTRTYLSAELARLRETVQQHEQALEAERELREQVLQSEADLRDRVLADLRAESTGREHGLNFAFAEQKEAIVQAHKDELFQLRLQHQGTTQLWESAVAMHHARAEGVRQGAMFRAAEAMEQFEHEKQLRLAEASRHGDELKQLRETHEFALSALRGKLQREVERNKKLEHDFAQERLWFERETVNLQAKTAGAIRGTLFAHRERLAEMEATRDHAAEQVAQWIAKLQDNLQQSRRDSAELRMLYEESDSTREALAQKVVESSLSAIAARARAEQLTDEIDQRSRAMAKVVAELTRATVEQHAAAQALRHGRVLPSMADVDAAIVAVSRRVPAEIAEELWGARSTIASAIFAGPVEEIEVP